MHRISAQIATIESLTMNLFVPQKKRTTDLRTVFRMLLGVFLLFVLGRYRVQLGWIVAAFWVERMT